MMHSLPRDPSLGRMRAARAAAHPLVVGPDPGSGFTDHSYNNLKKVKTTEN